MMMQRERDALIVAERAMVKLIKALGGNPDGVIELEQVRSALRPGSKDESSSVRVACVTLDGSTLTVPVDQIGDVLHGEDDQHTYTLNLKTMTRAEFEALGDFNGF